jgi:hypothetical protein
MAAVLTAIKVAHTIVWAFFVGCIVAIPVAALRDEHRTAGWLAGMVAVEVLILAVNQWRCPLTLVAGDTQTLGTTISISIFQCG